MPKLRLTTGPRTYVTSGGSGPQIQVPSVTTVLGILDDKTWMNKVLQSRGRKELDRLCGDAAVLGTRIHALADRLAWDREYKPDPDLEPYAEALREFLDTHVRRVIATELSLVSEKERVGGTCDLVAQMQDGSIAIIDWKSKKNGGITARDRAQTAGYALLLGEHGCRVTQRVIVRLHTKPGWEGRWYCRRAEDHWGDVRAFRAAVTLWHWKNHKKLGAEESA